MSPDPDVLYETCPHCEGEPLKAMECGDLTVPIICVHCDEGLVPHQCASA